MKLMLCIVLSGLFFLSVVVEKADAEDPDAVRIIEEIKLKGAKSVIERLVSGEKWTEFETVCDKIETGEKEWLEVARFLAPGSDAASAESLVFALARALPKSPRQVLSLVAETEKDTKGRFTVDRICISPFIEPEPGISERYLIETEKALESTDTSDSQRLDTLRLQCLDNIREIICNSKKKGLWNPKQ
jgi:hypothetical protein